MPARTWALWWQVRELQGRKPEGPRDAMFEDISKQKEAG